MSDMYCSCPYAEGVNNCKHMVAVLYEWEEEQQHHKGSGESGECWDNSSVRRYYTDFCIKNRKYDRTLEVTKEKIAIAFFYSTSLWQIAV